MISVKRFVTERTVDLGGISSCISGELRPNVNRTHSTKGKARE